MFQTMFIDSFAVCAVANWLLKWPANPEEKNADHLVPPPPGLPTEYYPFKRCQVPVGHPVYLGHSRHSTVMSCSSIQRLPVLTNRSLFYNTRGTPAMFVKIQVVWDVTSYFITSSYRSLSSKPTNPKKKIDFLSLKKQSLCFSSKRL